MNSLSCLGHVKRNDGDNRPPPPPLSADIEFAIDRSGSMYDMYQQTKTGTHDFVNSQKELANKTGIITHISIKTFDNRVETMPGFDGRNIMDTPDIDYSCLKPRGTTRLVDTACESLYEQCRRYINFKKKLPKMVRDLNPNIIRIFALITDGADNESSLFTPNHLNKLIRKLRNQGVTCMFLGANQDAIKQGEIFGFNSGHSMTYAAQGNEAACALRAVSDQIARTCTGDNSTHFSIAQRISSVPTNYGSQQVKPLQQCRLRRS